MLHLSLNRRIAIAATSAVLLIMTFFTTNTLAATKSSLGSVQQTTGTISSCQVTSAFFPYAPKAVALVRSDGAAFILQVVPIQYQFQALGTLYVYDRLAGSSSFQFYEDITVNQRFPVVISDFQVILTTSSPKLVYCSNEWTGYLLS